MQSIAVLIVPGAAVSEGATDDFIEAGVKMIASDKPFDDLPECLAM